MTDAAEGKSAGQTDVAPKSGAALMRKSDWRPALSPDGPRYRALADAIAEAVAEGALTPGERLPPVRDLAWELQVTPGTVARAYHLAENRGLLEGQVGRGTFVKAPAAALLADAQAAGLSPHAAATEVSPAALRMIAAADRGEPLIDLRMNCAVDIGQNAVMTRAMQALIDRRGALPLTDYHRYGEDAEQRAAAASWLASGGLQERPADTLICSGAQHGLLTALAATVGGGDAVALTEPLIHPGLKDCARALGVRLEPVEADPEHGMDPEALDAACARHRPGAIILTANHQNPTLATLPLARREAIAEIALRRRVPVIEDDVYGWTDAERLPSFPSLIPDNSWYVSSFSKCVAAGLRAGFILCPTGEGPRAARLMQGYTQHVSWLISALAAELITSGAAAEIVAAVRRESAARVGDLERHLRPALPSGGRLRLAQTVAMAWLELPEPWRASDFHAAALAAGVHVSPAEAFAVGRAPAPHAVRIAFGSCSRADLFAGLTRLAGVLRADPEPVDAYA